MLKELFRELFYPPYDFYDIMMIVFIVFVALLTCGTIVFSVHSFCINRKIRQFFAAHKPVSGMIVKYDAVDGDTYTMMHSLVPGQLTPAVPLPYRGADQYIIVLECRIDHMHFFASYKIHRDDYKEQQKGETVRIKDDWEPIGYEEIP